MKKKCTNPSLFPYRFSWIVFLLFIFIHFSEGCQNFIKIICLSRQGHITKQDGTSTNVLPIKPNRKKNKDCRYLITTTFQLLDKFTLCKCFLSLSLTLHFSYRPYTEKWQIYFKAVNLENWPQTKFSCTNWEEEVEKLWLKWSPVKMEGLCGKGVAFYICSYFSLSYSLINCK